MWRFCRNCLEQIANLEAAEWNASLHLLCRRVLHLSEAVLAWDFLPKRVPRRYVGRFLSTDRVLLRPNVAWRPLLTDGSVILLIIKVRKYFLLNYEISM